jgi:hypothetical protein
MPLPDPHAVKSRRGRGCARLHTAEINPGEVGEIQEGNRHQEDAKGIQRIHGGIVLRIGVATKSPNLYKPEDGRFHLLLNTPARLRHFFYPLLSLLPTPFQSLQLFPSPHTPVPLHSFTPRPSWTSQSCVASLSSLHC